MKPGAVFPEILRWNCPRDQPKHSKVVNIQECEPLSHSVHIPYKLLLLLLLDERQSHVCVDMPLIRWLSDKCLRQQYNTLNLFASHSQKGRSGQEIIIIACHLSRSCQSGTRIRVELIDCNENLKNVHFESKTSFPDITKEESDRDRKWRSSIDGATTAGNKRKEILSLDNRLMIDSLIGCYQFFPLLLSLPPFPMFL